MLLAAFAAPGKKDGLEEVKRVYQKAIEERYRFFSYGDASLWW
jgi:S-adenosylmethionine:tRNA-ribosyltransferase-isomerase (queuine synthetase)